MWSPANDTPSSSQNDSKEANEVVSNPKVEPKEAEVHLPQAHLRLDSLWRESREWDARVAPVKKISHDVLVIIFNHCAEDDWAAPMFLAGVCRTWRDAVLYTSRAWSFIDLNDLHALKLLPLFLERSHDRLLHIGLSSYRQPACIAIAQMAHRIQCLSVSSLEQSLDGIRFPFLKRLHLTLRSSPKSLMQLHRSNFPLVNQLELRLNSDRDLDPRSFEDSLDLPLLQTLRIHNNGLFKGTVAVLQKLGRNLKSLDLIIDNRSWDSRSYTINLPRLENLRFDDFRKCENLINIATPRLQKFMMITDYPSTSLPLKMDLGILTHVRVEGKQIPPILELSRLKVLQLDLSPPRYSETLKLLFDDCAICPELEIIEVRSYFWMDVQHSIVENLLSSIERSRGVKWLILRGHADWHQALPEVGSSPVSGCLGIST